MMNKEKNFISAVVYIHNVEKQLEIFLNNIIKIFEENFEYSEIICVNDCSNDNSLSVIREISQRVCSTSISVLNMSYFHGVEMAMNAGVDLSIGDFVYEFDNIKMDYNLDVVMETYYHALKGYDIVKAVADKKGKTSSRIFYYVFEKFADFSYEMSTESFRILSRRVINRISSMNKTVPYRKAVYANCGLKMDSVKYHVITEVKEKVDRKGKKYRIELAVNSLILFTQFGYRLAMLMTVIMMLMSIGVGIYSIITYFIAKPVEGWTTTILFLSIAFFGLFGILTVVVKYLQIMVEMVFKRKYYNFESIEKLTK